MKRIIIAGAIVAACLGQIATTAAAQPQIANFTLQNGIRVVSIYIPDSPHVSIFTFLPLGLAHDDAGRTQWSHLIEHLAIRSTIPDGSPAANAETLPDHMRLDFYGDLNNWKEGVSHHARWLKPADYDAKVFETEKTRVCAESDRVASTLATHKFAMAAWAQAVRHGASHAALKRDIQAAALADVQQYRNDRLAVLDKTLVCIVGGVDAQTVRPVLAAELGTIQSEARPAAPRKPQIGDRRITWDLNARHLVLTWRIPAVTDARYPALMVAGHLLTMQLFNDPELKQAAGMILAGADLATPEGNFFYISASIKPEASVADVQNKLQQRLTALADDPMLMAHVPMLAAQLAQQLTTCPDPALYKAQAPNVPEAMLQANVGLQYAMQDFRYGPQKTQLAAHLQKLTAPALRQAVLQLLTPQKCIACAIAPKADTFSEAVPPTRP